MAVVRSKCGKVLRSPISGVYNTSVTKLLTREDDMRTLWAFLVVCSLCKAATITVDLDGGGDYTEIQPANDAAADGDIVLIKAGGIRDPGTGQI